jgi:hypothetical protein
MNFILPFMPQFPPDGGFGGGSGGVLLATFFLGFFAFSFLTFLLITFFDFSFNDTYLPTAFPYCVAQGKQP